MSKFTQYAVAAAEMALLDAGWKPADARDREMTGVCLGSGIGNFDDFYNSALDYEQHVSIPSGEPDPASCAQRLEGVAIYAPSRFS